MASTQTTRYNTVAIILHWLTALIMFYMLVFGEDLIRRPRTTPLASDDWGPNTHASWGLVILLLTVLRIVWRLTHETPAHPATMKPWEIKLSAITHGLLYLLMLGIPVLGLFAFANYAPEHANADATFFKLFSVNFMPNLGGWTESAHAISTKLAWALIALHVLAALKHQFVDKDNLMARMRPGRG
ncbi:MAG: cytochrome b [Hyphomicrobiales bacterium]